MNIILVSYYIIHIICILLNFEATKARDLYACFTKSWDLYIISIFLISYKSYFFFTYNELNDLESASIGNF